jgi:hypothetical protein
MTEVLDGLSKGGRGDVILAPLNCANESHSDRESTESLETFTSDDGSNILGSESKLGLRWL